MEVKIDTKEKFTVVSPVLAHLSDNIAAELVNTCTTILQNPVKNVILNLEKVAVLEEKAAAKLAEMQSTFYDNHASFVICSLQQPVEDMLDKIELLEMLNITPTESEAWDIVQMEEIERELLDSDDIDFASNA